MMCVEWIHPAHDRTYDFISTLTNISINISELVRKIRKVRIFISGQETFVVLCYACLYDVVDSDIVSVFMIFKMDENAVTLRGP